MTRARVKKVFIGAGLSAVALAACATAYLAQKRAPSAEGEAPSEAAADESGTGAKKKGAGKKGKRNQAQAKTDVEGLGSPLAELASRPGTRLSDGRTYDNQAAVAETADGTVHVARVLYHNKEADEISVTAFKNGQPGEPVRVTTTQGQYIRPAMAASGDQAWLLWTTSEAERTASVWWSHLDDGRWSPPARLASDEARSHQNPEVTATADGRVAAAYQVHTGRAGYDIAVRRWDGRGFAAAEVVSDGAVNDWDAAVTFDKKGELHVVWSGFHDGDYDIYWRRLPGGLARRLSARGEYDLHPWVAAAPDGTVWTSWDVVRIPDHGNSGRTTITGANLRKGDGTHGKIANLASVEVRVIDGNTVLVPGRPRAEIVAPQGYFIAHTALAKVAVAPSGEPWLLYRVLRRAASTGGIGYYWDLLARPFRGGRWGEAQRFEQADGYLEEAAVAAGRDRLLVAYGGEHRSQHIPLDEKKARAENGQPEPQLGIPHEHAPGEPEHDHHRDFDNRRGWNGEVYLGSLAERSGSAPDRRSLVEALPAADGDVKERPRAEPYTVTMKGKTYRLLWGDTHRHSNVSRCSQGGEPSPDDLYRYGTDINRYDFFALSDHAEDPRITPYDVVDYYWWKQQKLADLYHVPGFMSVLYNFEWSLGYPHGHHNTIFPGRPTLRLDRSLAVSSTLAGGWKLLEKNNLKALTIPHTGADPGMGTAWEVQDDRYQRLCEIFQACRGSYECSGCPREFSNTKNKKGFYWNALEKGYHLGIIASSDHGYGVSYACVYAPENTRESIWQSMHDRRTYGATTYGLVLDVRSGDHWMGEEWKSRRPPALDVYVRGSALVGEEKQAALGPTGRRGLIRSIEIMGRSQVLYAEGSVESPLNARERRLRWSDPDWSKQTNEQWYYVRVIQTDDEMAWSSPVWVTPAR